jgi:integrase
MRERVIRNGAPIPGIWKRTTAKGEVVYEVAYRDSTGAQRRQVAGPRLRDAETKLAEIKASMGRGERVAPRRDLTLSVAAAEWLDTLTELRPSTRRGYEVAVRLHLAPRFGRRRLDSIDGKAVAKLAADMRTPAYRVEADERAHPDEPGKRPRKRPTVGYSTATVRHTLVTLSSVFDHATEALDWSGTNPVHSPAVHRVRKRQKQTAREKRILSGAELAALLAQARPPYALALHFLAATGARTSEALGLTWGALDLGKRTAHLSRQLDRSGHLAELKTAGSVRTIELPGALVQILREHKMAAADTSADALVFVSATGGPLDHRALDRYGLCPAFKAAKLAGRCPTPHELRHGHGSALIADGWDLVSVSKRLGHSNPNVTATVYLYEFEAAGRGDEQGASLDGLYGEGEADAATPALRVVQ